MIDITKVLMEEIEAFMKEYKLHKAIEINAGHCKLFSERVKKRIPEGEILHIDMFYAMPTMFAINPEKVENVGSWNRKKLQIVNQRDGSYPKVFDKMYITPFHQWIHINGKHYDAEEVNGVENFFDLPYFKDYIKAEEDPNNTLIERTNKESLRRMMGM